MESEQVFTCTLDLNFIDLVVVGLEVSRCQQGAYQIILGLLAVFSVLQVGDVLLFGFVGCYDVFLLVS